MASGPVAKPAAPHAIAHRNSVGDLDDRPKRRPDPQTAARAGCCVIALVSAAVALAITLVGWQLHAGAGDAVPDPQVGEGRRRSTPRRSAQLAALNGTGEGRGYADMAFKDAAGAPMTIADLPARRCWSISGPAGACRAARRCRRSTRWRPSTIRTASWCCRSISTSARAGSRRRRPSSPRGGWPNLPLYADSTFEAFKRLQAAGGGDRPAGDAAARREGLRAGGAAGPGRVGHARRAQCHRRADRHLTHAARSSASVP